MSNYPVHLGKQKVIQKTKPVDPKTHTGPEPFVPYTGKTSKAGEFAKPKGKDTLALMKLHAAAQPPRQMDTKSIISKLDTVPPSALPPSKIGDDVVGATLTAIVTHSIRSNQSLVFDSTILNQVSAIQADYAILSTFSVFVGDPREMSSPLKRIYDLLR